MAKEKRQSRANNFILVPMVVLSVCVAIFTYWGLTQIEAWIRDRQVANEYYYDDDDNIDSQNEIANESGVGNASESNALQTVAQNYATPETKIASVANETHSFISREQEREQAQKSRVEQSSDAVRRSVESQYVAPSAPSSTFMFDNAPTALPLFALTFDGGSFANAASDILDTLASRNVKSTFFLTGEFIRRFPNVVTRIASEGHELGNHTNRHPRLTTYAENRTHTTLPNVNRAFIANELGGAAQVLADRTGLRFAPFWRAPYGEVNREIARYALDAGYIHIGWRQGRTWYQNLDTNDWVPDASSSAYRTPREVYDKIVSIAAQPNGLNGGIILMHLGTERKDRAEQVHIILGRLIDSLRAMGYEPVRVSELLYRNGINVNAIAFGER